MEGVYAIASVSLGGFWELKLEHVRSIILPGCYLNGDLVIHILIQVRKEASLSVGSCWILLVEPLTLCQMLAQKRIPAVHDHLELQRRDAPFVIPLCNPPFWEGCDPAEGPLAHS